MKKGLYFLISFFCSAATCAAQHGWTIPNLHEMTQHEDIKHGATRLSDEDLTLLKQVTRKIIRECVQDPGPWSPKTTAGIFNALRVKRFVLTSDGKQGLVVQGMGLCMCGGTGNCPIWIIGENPHPELLLHREGVQSFATQQAKASDHFELVLGEHDSAMETYLEKYRFTGSKYSRVGCATLEWADEVGNEFDPPRITAQRRN